MIDSVNQNTSIVSLNRYEWLFIAIISVAYYFLVRQYICTVDDIMYAYNMTDHGRDWSMPITSLIDAVKSQAHDYLNRNGRVLTHTLVQWFCGMEWGKQVFYVLSSLMFGVLNAGMIKLIKYLNYGRCMPMVVLLLIMIFVPQPGAIFMGNMAFTMNYLWPSASAVWVIYWFVRLKDGCKPSKTLLIELSLFCILAGWQHEGFSLPIAGMMFFYLCLNRKNVSKQMLWFVFAYWIGTLLCATAPSNYLRSNETTYLVGYGQSFASKVIMVSTGLLKGQLLVQTFVVLCFVLYVYQRKNKDLKISSYWYLALFGALSLCFDIFVAYIGVHQLTPIALAVTLILAGFISRVELFRDKKVMRSINLVLALGFVIFYSATLDARCRIRYAWDEILRQAAIPGVEYINSYNADAEIKKIPPIILNYTDVRDLQIHISNGHYFETLIGVLATNGSNPDKIKTVLPNSKENIVESCSQSNMLSESLYDGGDYIIARVPAERCVATMNINYVYHPGFVGTLLRKLGRQGAIQTYSLTFNEHTFTADGYCYAIVYINPQSLDEIRADIN